MSANPMSQFDCFAQLSPESLRLDVVDATTFQAHRVWCPAGRSIMYGGQLIAHAVEAAHRTVDSGVLRMHSLRITFASPGRDVPDVPVQYSVSPVREGRTFTLRSVRATQGGKLLLVAIASFYKPQARTPVHEMAPPRFARAFGLTDRAAAFSHRLAQVQDDPRPSAGEQLVRRRDARSGSPQAASFTFLNLFSPPDHGSSYAKDVWMKVVEDGVQRLAVSSGIPSSRIHLIVACWLSDVIVAIASLFPHGYPDVKVNMMASLDHCIYVHNTAAINVSEWFVFEVRNSWSNSAIALNHGRLYGKDGTLWMSVAQQTVARLGKPALRSTRAGQL